jgi:hypothetical protein
MHPAWMNRMLASGSQCLRLGENIGNKGGNNLILIVKNSSKPIFPLLHYSNWGETPKFDTIVELD